MYEKFKTDTNQEEKKEKKDVEKKKFNILLEEDNVEIKLLEEADVEEVVKVMRKCSFDVTDKEVSLITVYGMSFGAFVNRILIGVGLGWPANFDENQKKIMGGEANAIYMEDAAILISYEGRGIRRILLKERENEAKNRNFLYSVAYLSADLPKSGVDDYIKEAGSQVEKLYLSESYEFMKTDKGILVMKKL